MAAYHISSWKKIPFLLLFISLASGILLQWYGRLSITTWWWVIFLSLPLLLSLFFIPFFERYKLLFLSGITTAFLFIAIGGLLASQKDIRNDRDWFGHSYQEQDLIVVELDEPPVEKTKTFKAIASVRCLFRNGHAIPVKGKIIVYFQKLPVGATDTMLMKLDPGVQLILKSPLQMIANGGNPGGFDYARYCIFRGISHQSYLKPGEYVISDVQNKKWIRSFLNNSREKLLGILRQYIPGQKERGLAEALLIGYKNDLDPALVQSYSNTGVVHIIAISGLHLGLIYWLLVQVFRPLQKSRATKRLVPFFIITGLWLFSLLAGAQPSILRSALMFTCIVIGENMSRKTSIYNSLAVSAFVLLCINPFWLWDVGFQLSYAAVLSIIIFMRPIYNWFYIKNKLLDQIWKLNAITLAAQILTVPLCIYHFHQFPSYFLLSNVVAVPLSSLILFAEILLCSFFFIPFAASLTGKLISQLIFFMNSWVEKIESLPGSLWEGLQISLFQTILLFLFAAGTGNWLLEKSKTGLYFGLSAFLVFIFLRSQSISEADRQQKIIVYNVPQKKAIDLVRGRNYIFIGDSDLRMQNSASRFHLQPSRVRFRLTRADTLSGVLIHKKFITYRGLHILHIEEPMHFIKQEQRPAIDLLILSKNPKIYMSRLAALLEIRQVVFDGSVPAWKSRYWKKDCDSLHIPWHDVKEKGAFVMNLN